MPRTHGSRQDTAFTTSIEARVGVTTGISASDRARTIAVAIDAGSAADDIVSPGHIFPLIARDGGVLVRAGHTEAAVDISRLAGLNPSGVICEIMNDDGTMARMPELIRFAQAHNLKMGAIRDLIAFRLKHDNSIVQTEQAEFESRWGGKWTARTFLNKTVGSEQIALVKGEIDPSKPTLVRMHQLDICADTFGELGARGSVLQLAMETIAEAGSGVIVAVNRIIPNPFSQALAARSNREFKDMEALRDYGLGAQILAALGIHEMILLTNHHHTPVALSGFGLKIVEERPIASRG
jgi:3,4-dihydroxy 2-butanone 4-phosphate synthase/GTP cyclohydrolase II